VKLRAGYRVCPGGGCWKPKRCPTGRGHEVTGGPRASKQAGQQAKSPRRELLIFTNPDPARSKISAWVDLECTNDDLLDDNGDMLQ